MWAALLFAVSPGLIVVTASMSLIVVAIMHFAYPSEAADPFAPYEIFLPSQPVTEHALQLCFVQASTDMSRQMIGCRQESGRTPYIQSTMVSIWQGMFRQFRFTTTDITIGDVVRRWGHPRVVRQDSRSGSLCAGRAGCAGSSRRRVTPGGSAICCLLKCCPSASNR